MEESYMKYFLIGTAVALVALLIGYMAGDWSLAWMISGAIGFLALIRAGLAMRSKNSSAKVTSSEKRRERQEQLAKVRHAFLFAVPNFIVAIIVLLMFE